MSTPYDSLNDGLIDIEAAITSVDVVGGITPEVHGGVLERVLRTVYAVSGSGVAGAAFLGGSGLPDGGLGVVDDHYVRYEDGKVYKKTGVSTWTYTGYTLKGAAGATGSPGATGPAGAAGASRDLRVSGTELQTKLSTEPVGSYTTIYDLATIQPVIAIASGTLTLKYKLAGQDDSAAVTLYDLSNLAPAFRVQSDMLQWKLASQGDVDYQDVFDFADYLPVFRNNLGTLEWKYANEDNSAYRSLGGLETVSVIDGDALSIDVTLSNITPDTSTGEAPSADQLGAILKGIDNYASGGKVKMRIGTLSAGDITANSHDFSVALANPANAVVLHNGTALASGLVTVNSAGVMSWTNGGTFDGVAAEDDSVILLSY